MYACVRVYGCFDNLTFLSFVFRLFVNILVFQCVCVFRSVCVLFCFFLFCGIFHVLFAFVLTTSVTVICSGLFRVFFVNVCFL